MHRLKVIALSVLLTLGLLSGKSAYADNELKNVELAVFLNPLGAPFVFFKEDLTTLYGIDVDIVYELQKRLGFTLKENRIFPLLPTQGFEKMKAGGIDLYGGGLSHRPDYAKDFAPLTVYIKSSIGILYSSKHHPNFKSTKDFKGTTIGTMPGRDTDKYAQSFGAEAKLENNLSYAVFLVTQNRLDGVMHDRMILDDFARLIKVPSVAILSEEFGKSICQYTFYVPKVSPHRRYLAAAMQSMVNDGTVARIMKKWGVKVPEYKKKNQGNLNKANTNKANADKANLNKDKA